MQANLLLAMYRNMTTIRQFERAAVRLLQQGLVVGSLHVCTGQEAVGTGVCFALEKTDYITTSHRGHGHVIGKGLDIKLMMAEMMGRATGICKGIGGSMHMVDPSIGLLGENGVVSGGVPIAVGAGLSAKMRSSGQVAVAFFGDGAINEGQFHEAMNLAAVWKLPVIFVCDNNQFAISTPIADASAGSLVDRAAGYGLPGFQVDGNDVVGLYEATREAVQRARSGGGPTVFDALTYRWEGHSRNDSGWDYRTREEVEEWKKKDPIARLGDRLIAEGVATAAQLQDVEESVKAELEEAIAFAKESPVLDPADMLEFNYA